MTPTQVISTRIAALLLLQIAVQIKDHCDSQEPERSSDHKPNHNTTNNSRADARQEAGGREAVRLEEPDGTPQDSAPAQQTDQPEDAPRKIRCYEPNWYRVFCRIGIVRKWGISEIFSQ